jgi:hypothetical protein
MLIRLDDTSHVDDLCVHFWRSGFTVLHAGGTMIEVQRRDAPTSAQARREVVMHLRLWDAINPGAPSELVAS